jgi:hypothetical protein
MLGWRDGFPVHSLILLDDMMPDKLLGGMGVLALC